jgi:hypothetical protein
MENAIVSAVRDLVAQNATQDGIVRECVRLIEQWGNQGNITGDVAMARLAQFLEVEGY